MGSFPANSATVRRLRNVRSVLADVAIFIAATVGSLLAEAYDRPRSAALIYLVGVMAVGARSGLARGLAAAIAASFVFNFFLSEPRFTLTAGSADEVIPLIAFNVSAIVTGALAGRLKDSARQARAAEAKNALLLRLSGRLQQAITVSDVARIARGVLPFGRILDLEIYLLKHGAFVSVEGQRGSLDPVHGPAGRHGARATRQAARAYSLNGAEGEIGVACFMLGEADAGAEEPDLQGVANILGLTVDRCLLLEQLSESHAVQRSEELKTAILSSVSHDLRTPLTAIEAAATSLRAFENTLSAGQRAEMLATISEQCRKLNRYTANLLDMGRIQSGIPANLFIDIDLIEILGVALAAVREAYPGQEIEKQIRLDIALVRANPPMLEQLIFNLIDNAIVHGSTDDPIVIRLARDGESCVLEVIDFGRGIPAEEQPLVFNKFYRARSSMHREGNGLGLHIAQGFAQAFGGEIAIRSPYRDGVGTCMSLRLPLVAERHLTIGAWE
ncbi:MAG TPA: ATP-binding protein [Sphingomonadaceae bacterium]